MKKFKVYVSRLGYGMKGITVEALNKKKAIEKAVNEAPNHVFLEFDATYHYETVEEAE